MNQWFFFAVIFFAVSFIIAMTSISNSALLAKQSDSKYDEMFQNLTAQNSDLKNKIYDQDIDLNDLNNKLDNLKIKNPYLK